MEDQRTHDHEDHPGLDAPPTPWGPYPGDALAPPPTPRAPEIPMSTTWPWVAGASIALRYVIPVVVVLAIIVAIVGLMAHWA